MQIEAGKYYRTRDGRKAGPLCAFGEGWGFYGPVGDGGKAVWTRSGQLYVGPPGSNWWDLIAEWTDEADTPETYVQPEDYAAVPVRNDAEVARPYPFQKHESQIGGDWNASAADVQDEDILAAAAAYTPGAAAWVAAMQPSIKEVIADEAKRIVTGARRAAYGPPEDNFARIARFWTAYFQNTGRDLTISAADVSPLMRLMKEARLCETPDHYDSHVDLVGYALTGAEVAKVRQP